LGRDRHDHEDPRRRGERRRGGVLDAHRDGEEHDQRAAGGSLTGPAGHGRDQHGCNDGDDLQRERRSSQPAAVGSETDSHAASCDTAD
jgi:hypothetical protein